MLNRLPSKKFDWLRNFLLVGGGVRTFWVSFKGKFVFIAFWRLFVNRKVVPRHKKPIVCFNTFSFYIINSIVLGFVRSDQSTSSWRIGYGRYCVISKVRAHCATDRKHNCSRSKIAWKSDCRCQKISFAYENCQKYSFLAYRHKRYCCQRKKCHPRSSSLVLPALV